MHQIVRPLIDSPDIVFSWFLMLRWVLTYIAIGTFVTYIVFFHSRFLEKSRTYEPKLFFLYTIGWIFIFPRYIFGIMDIVIEYIKNLFKGKK